MMSLFSLANRSAADLQARREGEFESAEVHAGGEMPARQEPPPDAAQALGRLLEFLPMETVAAFWLAVPAAALLAGEAEVAKIGMAGMAASSSALTHPNEYDWAFFFILLVLTPILLLLQFLSRAPRDAKHRLPRPAEWPWWRMLASGFAFSLWGMAVPGNPFLTTPGQLMTAWAVAVLSTGILGYLDKIFFRSAE
jgi:hypothetical protein